MPNIVNSKKISQELVKNFYSKRQFQMWNVVDYDNISKLVIFNGHSIYRVFKRDFIIQENEHGFKKEALEKCFNADLSEYKKATKIEVNKKYDEVNKKFYTCFYPVTFLKKYIEHQIVIKNISCYFQTRIQLM
jgi:hypothetical protein